MSGEAAAARRFKFGPILTATVFTVLLLWIAGRVAEVLLQPGEYGGREDALEAAAVESQHLEPVWPPTVTALQGSTWWSHVARRSSRVIVRTSVRCGSAARGGEVQLSHR